MALNDINRITFSQVVKAPATYMLMVAVAIMMFFVTKFGNASDQVNVNCEAEKAELRKENAQYKADKDALTTALLVKNGIILKQAQDQADLDSTIRTKVGKKAKKIVKEN
jgi:cell division protein FtsB